MGLFTDKQINGWTDVHISGVRCFYLFILHKNFTLPYKIRHLVLVFNYGLRMYIKIPSYLLKFSNWWHCQLRARVAPSYVVIVVMASERL